MALGQPRLVASEQAQLVASGRAQLEAVELEPLAETGQCAEKEEADHRAEGKMGRHQKETPW